MKQIQKNLAPILFMLLGTGLTLWCVVLMNKTIEKKIANDNVATKVVANKVIKKFNKPPSKPKAKLSNKTAKQPLPDLSLDLSGLDFDADEMGFLSEDQMIGTMFGDLDKIVMTSDTVDTAPVPLDNKLSSYPEFARQKGLSGFVTVNLLISSQGRVKETQILDASPKGVFEVATLAAVRNWRFEPATYQGQKVQVWSTQTVRFDLQ